jgi:6-phosphogluconolactonase
MVVTTKSLQMTEQFEPYITRNSNKAAQAEVLATAIAVKLSTAIRARGRAAIAFSGGSTPAQFLEQLANQPVDWSNVDITLVDERCVAEDDERSNAGMLRARLLDALPKQPTFAPLYVPGESAVERKARFKQFALPFDVVHLGMGEDAHTASFFPDAPNIEAMLDLRQSDPILQTQSPTSREPRLTWSLATILQSQFVVLQVTGAAKWAVLSDVLEALAAGEVSNTQLARMPILAVLARTQLGDLHGVPAQIYFASE